MSTQPSSTHQILPFRYLLRVRYGECDNQQVVFNPRYGEYVDLACFEFLRAVLPKGYDCMKGEFEVMTVKQSTEWKASCRFDDVLEIRTTVPHMGTSSFTMRFEIRVLGDDALRVACETVYVYVVDAAHGMPGAAKRFEKAPLPEVCRKALAYGGPSLIVDHAGASPSHPSHQVGAL